MKEGLGMSEEQTEVLEVSGRCPLCGVVDPKPCKSLLTGAEHPVYRHKGREGHERAMRALTVSGGAE